LWIRRSLLLSRSAEQSSHKLWQSWQAGALWARVNSLASSPEAGVAMISRGA
jgi:hypothetical protein